MPRARTPWCSSSLATFSASALVFVKIIVRSGFSRSMMPSSSPGFSSRATWCRTSSASSAVILSGVARTSAGRFMYS